MKLIPSVIFLVFINLNLPMLAAENNRCSLEEASFAKSMLDIGTGRQLPMQELWELEDTALRTALCAALLSKDDYCLIQGRKLENRKMFVYLKFRSGDIPSSSVNRFLITRVEHREMCDNKP